MADKERETREDALCRHARGVATETIGPDTFNLLERNILDAHAGTLASLGDGEMVGTIVTLKDGSIPDSCRGCPPGGLGDLLSYGEIEEKTLKFLADISGKEQPKTTISTSGVWRRNDPRTGWLTRMKQRIIRRN